MVQSQENSKLTDLMMLLKFTMVLNMTYNTALEHHRLHFHLMVQLETGNMNSTPYTLRNDETNELIDSGTLDMSDIKVGQAPQTSLDLDWIGIFLITYPDSSWNMYGSFWVCGCRRCYTSLELTE